MSKPGTGAPRSIISSRITAIRSPICARCWRESRATSARLSGLGLILQDIGDDKDALEAYRKALAIDPHLENIPEVVKTLTEKVEGRNI